MRLGVWDGHVGERADSVEHEPARRFAVVTGRDRVHHVRCRNVRDDERAHVALVDQRVEFLGGRVDVLCALILWNDKLADVEPGNVDSTP